MTLLLKFGITSLLVGLGLWIYEHEYENVLPISKDLDVWLATAGGISLILFGLVALYGVLSGATTSWGRKNRCVKCGVKVPKNSMYCNYHKKENANKFLKRDSGETDYDGY